jgi:hypothetical protein
MAFQDSFSRLRSGDDFDAGVAEGGKDREEKRYPS